VLLRTRITLLVGIAVLLLAMGLLLAGHLRVGQLAEDARLRLAGRQQAVLTAILASARKEPQHAVRLFLRDVDPAALLARGDRAGVEALLQDRLLDPGRVDAAELADLQGRLLASTVRSEAVFRDPLVTGWPLARVAETGEVQATLRALPDGGVALVQVERLAGPEGGMLMITARNLSAILLDSARLLGEAVLAVDRQGRPLVATGPVGWAELREALREDGPQVQVLEAGDRLYSATRLSLGDASAGRMGTLFALQDVTESEGRYRLHGTALTVGALLFVALILALLSLTLHGAFARLTRAVEVLDALGRGDTALTLPVDRRGDEIGRISRAVAAFREKLQQLHRLQTANLRRRQRQERFIRGQMQTLANTLESDARHLLLRELDRIEAESRKAGAGGGADDGNLEVIAVAFQRMAGRVAEQHARLSQLVQELREALAHKTKLLSLQQELQIAQKIQLSILPQAPVQEALWGVFGRMIPAKEVGGDFYDYFPLDNGRIGVVVADVSGKGVPAAFFMLITRTLLRATAMFGMAPGACLTRLNRLLCAENDEMMFVTLFYGVLDPRAGTFTYSNGGHNPPYHLGPHGITAFGGQGQMALAVLEEAEYADEVLTLGPGEAVVMFTDGVTESFDADQTIFGDDRLVEVLAQRRDTAAQSLVDRVMQSVLTFTGEAPLADDVTCLALHFGPLPTGAVGGSVQTDGAGRMETVP